MARVRLHGLRCLLYALVVLAIAPCVMEFALRIRALRDDVATPQSDAPVTVVASAVMHHQLAPLQARHRVSSDDGTDFVFRTNSFGLRGAEVVVPKPPGTFRIVCLGDETVLAEHLPEPLTFCHRLQELLQTQSPSPIEVLNAGVPDFCSVLSYLQVKQQLLALQPDVLIAHWDVSDLADHRRYRLLTEVGADETPLACLHPSLLATPKIKPICEHFLCANWLNQQLGGWLAAPVDDRSSPVVSDEPANDPQAVMSSLEPVDQLSQLAEAANCRVVLAVHPQLDQQLAPPARGESSDDSRVTSNRVLDDFTASTGVPICHVAATLQRVPQPETAFAADRRSLTRIGHEVYAYALANTILKRTPGPWLPAQPSSRAPVVPIAAEPRTLPDSDRRSNPAEIRSTTFLSRPRDKSVGEIEHQTVDGTLRR